MDLQFLSLRFTEKATTAHFATQGAKKRARKGNRMR